MKLIPRPRSLVQASMLLNLVLLGADSVRDFAKWEPEIRAYEQMDTTNMPPRGGLLFIGSSTIRLWKTLTTDFSGKPVINRGFGGSEIEDSTHFAARIVFPYKPSKIFLRAGGNDIHAGKSPEQVFADFREFVAKIHSELPRSEIVFIGLCPSVARWQQAQKEKALNQMVERYAGKTDGVKYIETYKMSLDTAGKPRPELFVQDQLHFNAQGYKLLADLVRPFL